jgi:hypothetical protein
MIHRMFEEGNDNDSFEDMVRSIAEEIGRSVERLAGQVDVDEFAGAVGVDPERARDWVQTAGSWLRARAESLGDEVAARRPWTAPEESPSKPAASGEDPLRGAHPSALDLPTEEQGLALAALESGRWIVEPGSDALASRGEGPGPSDGLGLFRELLVRDWINTEGEVTLVGHRALDRWLAAADR